MSSNVNAQSSVRAQALSIEVRSNNELLSHTMTWCAGADESAATIELPRGGEIFITTPSLGKVSFEGFMQLDMSRSAGEKRVLVWSNAARSRTDDCDSTITLRHPNDEFPEVTLNITCEEEASLAVEEGDAPTQPSVALANLVGTDLADFLAGRGAYVVSAIAAVGALIFAWLMPAHQSELLGGAGGIALWSFWFTNRGDKFGLRILAFCAAAVAMGVALAMPENADNAIYAAGVACLVAIVWGDEL